MPADDFSLALAGAFLDAGVERFQVLGDGAARRPPRAFDAPMADPQLLSALLVDADIVLAESAVEGAALDRRLMKGVVRLRRGRPMLLVDASADGSLVDHRVASLDGVFLYTVADLAAITATPPGRVSVPTTPASAFSPMRFALFAWSWANRF